MKTILFLTLLSFSFSFVPQKSFAQKEPIEIGFILANLFMERWQKEKEYFESQVNDLGGNVTFIDCYDLPENQIKAAEKLIKQGVDAIVVIPVDAVGAAPVIELAKKAQIPVMAYDRLILNAPLDYYITFNSVSVGELMAKAVINKISEGNIIFLGGSSDDYNSKLIRQGVFNVLNPVKEKYNIYSTQVSSWNELDAYLKVQDYMSSNESEPDAIICAADILTRGVIEALIENDLLGNVILTGQDAELDICKHVAKGDVELTIYKPGKLIAEKAANELWKILTEKNYVKPKAMPFEENMVHTILLEPTPITKNTLEETVIKDNYFTYEQVFGE